MVPIRILTLTGQAERARAPFATSDDFRARQILAAARVAALHFEDGTRHP
jgi:hypothetical protein